MGENDKPADQKPPPKKVDGATDKEHAFKLKRVLLKVSVRTDFLVRDPFLVDSKAAGGVEFHFSPGEPVANVSVVLPFTKIELTKSDGIATLDVTGVPDGNYTLVIFKNTPETANTDEIAGPDTCKGLATAAVPERIYRPLSINVKLEGGKLKDAKDPYDPDSQLTWGRIGNRNAQKIADDHLPIDYRPVWMKSPREISARALGDVTSITCHCTSGAKISGTLNRFISPLHFDADKSKEDVGSAHYVVDHDGHVIKCCRENNLVFHVGAPCMWEGHNNVNPFTVGIECVHRTQEHSWQPAEIPYNKYQIAALLALMGRLQGDADMKIEKKRVFGHGDADMGGSRDSDPGQNFPWEQLEAAGWGMIPQTEITIDTDYGGFFTELPGSSLRAGNHDGHDDPNPRKRTPGSYGGPKDKPANTIPVDGSHPPIKELQQDLSAIGFTTDVTGVYDDLTVKQVQKFQWHFFSVSRKRKADGVVDAQTAGMLKAVRAFFP